MNCVKYSEMKNFATFVLLILALHQLNASEVQCEKKQTFLSRQTSEPIKICFMDNVTTIDATGFNILPMDDTVEGLRFEENKKIRYLPEKVVETFPNLMIYWAQSCSLTEISKKHFKSLIFLRELFLGRNQIERIISNTFEDLTSLERLELRKKIANKIHFRPPIVI